MGAARNFRGGSPSNWKTSLMRAVSNASQPSPTSIAFLIAVRHSGAVSDKQLALDSIQRLPDDTDLDAIAERLDFLAGIRKGLDQIERGETVAHDEVKRQLATWLTE